MRNKLNNKAICVLGMHRSGTSAAARAINLLGVSLGNPEHLIGEDKDINPKGYWEHRQINEIHDNILSALSRTWNDLYPMPDNWLGSSEIAAYKKQLRELIKVEFSDEQLWGFKDPRTCLLIPLWNEILNDLEVETKYIIVIRNPIDLAKSLNKRDQLSLNESLLLWQQHTLLSLKDTKGYDRCILHYDNLIRDWKPALKKVSQSLLIPWPDDEIKLEVEMQSFLDPNLRHSSSTLNDLQELRVSNSVKQTYSLCQRANDDPEYLSSEEFAQKTEDFLQDFNMFSEILLPELRESLHTKNRLIRTLQIELTQRDSQIVSKDRELKSKIKLINEKNQIIQNKDLQIQFSSQRIDDLDYHIQDKNKLLSDITNTLSWRITQPIRWIGQLLIRGGIIPITWDRNIEFIKNSANKTQTQLNHVFKLNLRSASEIIFPNNEKPEISIIIPVFNKWKFTLNCLKSITENTKNISYEVILVDNASEDKTPKLANNIKNIIYLRNQENLGFVEACNKGAEIAKGEYLVFLNNDTFVNKDWLKELRNTFDNFSNVGLVGSKLIFPNGTMQEAGGIVWKNWNVSNYGRGNDPQRFEFNYVKEVDYCSGASIMIRADIFRKLGGFDTIYSPAYFEDTDLSFRVRQLNLKTLYQPASELIHFEGITAGKDVNEGLKKYQELNKDKFFERWNSILETENCDELEGAFRARDRSRSKKIILFIDYYVPLYDQHAGSYIVFEYLKVLLELGYKIIFWPDDLLPREPYTKTLQQMGIEVIYGDENFESYMINNSLFIDIVILSKPGIAQKYIHNIRRFSQAKIIYFGHDIHFLRKQREAKITGNTELTKDTEKTRIEEVGVMSDSDISLFFSGLETDLIKKEYPFINVEYIPWIQNTGLSDEQYTFEEREGIVFIGGFLHKPNIDAVLWLHDEIYPKIREKIPEAEIIIIGSNTPDTLFKLKDKKFNIMGYVQDIGPILKKAKVFVAPLRYGAGFKGKIAMAMSYGVPTVTTDIGAEGINIINGDSAYISNDPSKFAEYVAELYTNRDLWNKISKNSLDNIKVNYSADIAKNKINSIIQNI